MTDEAPASDSALILLQIVWNDLRNYALAFPETVEEHPWNESAMKVKKRVFVFLSGEPTAERGLNITVKLPLSGEDALHLPFTEPTGYGLGQHGWVSAHFLPGEQPPIDLLQTWIRESYCAVAPKRLVKQLDEAQAAT